MRVKTSPADLLEQIDKAASNRSSFLESAARERLAHLDRARRDCRDAAILAANAGRLNREALDVLEYQEVD